jgi:hypothetical protein
MCNSLVATLPVRVRLIRLIVRRLNGVGKPSSGVESPNQYWYCIETLYKIAVKSLVASASRTNHIKVLIGREGQVNHPKDKVWVSH